MAVLPFLIYGNADVSLPNKLFEAVLARIPILTSNTESITKFLQEHPIGKVFEAGSPVDLASKAIELFSELDQIRSSFTPELLEMASWDGQADRLISLYNRVLDLPPSPPVRIEVQDITENHLARAIALRPTSVAIGPRNSAGQAYMMATAIQTHLNVPAFSFSVGDQVFGFPVHQHVDGRAWRDPKWQLHQRRSLSSSVTHVLAESGTGVLGTLNGGFIDEQLPLLKEDGLQLGLILHGSEIRDPRRHRHLPYSPYSVNDELTRSLEQATAKLRRHLEGLDIPMFVTTPDLLEDVDGVWLPAVVDLPRWEALKEAFTESTPTILHLPSRSRLKGSEYIDPILRRLETEGKIRYLRPADRVQATDVVSLIEQADIVIDGIVIGAYGVMSCQALAAGRLSIANLAELGPLGEHCPIVSADPGSLDSVLRDLLEDRESWKERAEAGREYVGSYHSGSYTADSLKPFLGVD